MGEAAYNKALTVGTVEGDLSWMDRRQGEQQWGGEATARRPHPTSGEHGPSQPLLTLTWREGGVSHPTCPELG